MNLFMAMALMESAGSSAVYVGGRVATNSAAEAYPAGTITGDLVIAVSHGSVVPATPPGFTSAFSTTGDPNGYAKRVSFKISAGETTCDMSGGSNGFDQTIVVIRGRTSVSASYSWSYATAGATTGLTVAVAGTAILIASDRGGAGFPSFVFPGFGHDGTFSATSTYFYQRTQVYLNVASSQTFEFVDNNDSYGTSGLEIIAI